MATPERPPVQKVLLFDWREGGHHEEYLNYAARALRDRYDVAIAAPETARSRLAEKAEFVSLGASRPDVVERDLTQILKMERALLLSAIRSSGAGAALHMFGDELVPYLARGPRSSARVSVLVFRKASHYPRHFQSKLFPHEWQRELAFDAWLALWRRRPDAGRVVLFDEYAVRLMSRRGRAPIWLPEAPVVVPDGLVAPGTREGVALGGALAWRKGIEQLGAAVASAPTDMRVTLAGRSVPGYEETVRDQVELMRAAGAQVDLRDRWLDYGEYLQVLASAKVVAAPYPRHRGSSRLIVEAAAVGTPVVADRYGLLGRRVRDHGIGLVVDGENPRELRAALDALLADDGALVDPNALRRFADSHTAAAFAAALSAAVAP